MRKMEPAEQQIYSILLDVQKQIGDLSRETGEQTEKLNSIDIQTKKTNGRVTSLETWKTKVEQEKSYNAGKFTVISLLGGLIATIVISFIRKKLGL